jgi:hypothetical protein
MKEIARISATALIAIGLALGVLAGIAHAAEVTNMVVRDGKMDYETVAAGQTDQVCGATGGIGDYLDRVILVVTTAATAATSIEDGSTNIAIFPNSPGGGVGTYTVELGMSSVAGGWEITTGAGVAAICVGRFTP